MSDYTQLTTFATKDALVTGNPLKIVRGAEIDPELIAIATAIATKLDSSDAANPTATIGLAAVNGVAATYMRSDSAPALSQAIAPTWSGQHIFSKNGTTAVNSAIVLQTGINPFLAWNQTGAAANNRAWDMGADSGVLLLRAVDDAATTANNVLAVTRSGAAISNVSFGNTTNNPTYTFLGSGTTSASAFTSAQGQYNYAAGVAGFMEQVNRSAGALGYKIYLGASGGTPTVSWDSSGNLTNPGTIASGNISASQTAGSISVNSSTATNATNLLINRAGVGKGRYGVEGTAGGAINGDLVDDVYVWSTSRFIVSADSGGAIQLIVAPTALTFGNATANPTYTFAGSGAISGVGSGLTALNAGNISTGTLAVGRGGTGVTALGNITKVDDTNVTLTLGGTPTGAVVNATSFTMGWTGVLSVARGGTGQSTFTPGYLEIPQNSQNGNYTGVLADSAKHIYHPVGAAAGHTYTIPANASVAYPIGTAITFVNDSSNTLSIAITTDTMVLSPGGTTGTRTLASEGMATAIKVTATRWMISGSGLT